MFQKTTSISYTPYGMTFTEELPSPYQTYQIDQYMIKIKEIDTMDIYDEDILIKVNHGIVLLIIQDSKHHTFVIHRTTLIKANTPFALISLTDSASYKLYSPLHLNKQTIQVEPYIYKRIAPSFQITEIFSYYYQVRNSHYQFKEEAHPYWELTYVDNGTLDTTIDDVTYTLNEFDLILYAPNQKHTQQNISDKTCSYLTIIFDTNFTELELIQNKIFSCKKDLYTSLQQFIQIMHQPKNVYAKDLFISCLQILFIKLLQYDTHEEVEPTTIQQRFENELLNEIILYIHDHIDEPISVQDITYLFSISRATLQNLFQANLKVAPKHYILELKLTRSCSLIQENHYTISEISDLLGFNSIHYFSRFFKKRYGISPTLYKKSLNVIEKDRF